MMLRSIFVAASLLAGSALAQDRPAVRLLPAKPMDPVEAITARAVPEVGYDPLATRVPNEPAKVRTMFDRMKATEDPAANDAPRLKQFSKWMDDRAKAVKKAVGGSTPQPEPRVGVAPGKKPFDFGKDPAPATPPTALKKLFDFKKDAPPPTAKVNVADPAYRWYGWGTATPGANPYAPAGDYPMGSSQWYNQSGATPGAFPVPTMNPYRPVPGSEAPAYVPPPPPALPAPVMTPFVPPPSIPVAKPIAQTPAYLPKPVAVSTRAAPVATTIPVVPAMPKPIEPSWRPAPVNAVPDPNWKPTEKLIVPIIRSQEPEFGESPLGQAIHAAGRGVISNVVIRETGPRQLSVSFDATTATMAEIAVRAISNIGELKPYTIDFDATVKQ